MIKWSEKFAVTVRKSDMAQFGLKAEKDTPLRVYVERRPKTQTGRVTWDKIFKQAIDNRQKADRDKSVSRRQPVDGSAVLTTNSIIPCALCINYFTTITN